MPQFTGIKTNDQLLYDDPRGYRRFVDKLKNGQRFKETISAIKHKTNPQLGYYWGLLLVEIHKHYEKEEFTFRTLIPSVKIKGMPLIIDSFPQDIKVFHEYIKDICGLVGDNGVRTNVEDMNEYQMSKFIDNVLRHAVNDLGMNSEALEAKRPTIKQEYEPEKPDDGYMSEGDYQSWGNLR